MAMTKQKFNFHKLAESALMKDYILTDKKVKKEHVCRYVRKLWYLLHSNILIIVWYKKLQELPLLIFFKVLLKTLQKAVQFNRSWAGAYKWKTVQLRSVWKSFQAPRSSSGTQVRFKKNTALAKDLLINKI